MQNISLLFFDFLIENKIIGLNPIVVATLILSAFCLTLALGIISKKIRTANKTPLYLFSIFLIFLSGCKIAVDFFARPFDALLIANCLLSGVILSLVILVSIPIEIMKNSERKRLFNRLSSVKSRDNQPIREEPANSAELERKKKRLEFISPIKPPEREERYRYKPNFSEVLALSEEAKKNGATEEEIESLERLENATKTLSCGDDSPQSLERFSDGFMDLIKILSSHNDDAAR